MTAAVADVARRDRALRHVELLVNRKLDGLLAGDFEGLVRGVGSEPADGRAYEPGDDARRIDWSLTARSGSTFVRDTTADRELETWLVLDRSASLDFGTADCEKRDLALAAASAFALLTVRNGNRVAAVEFDGTGSRVRRPRAGRDGAFALLRDVGKNARVDSGTASLAVALRRARTAARRRGLLVVVSDLLDESDWSRELRAATARHDVVVAHVTDPRERALPSVGLLTLVDPETGQRCEIQTADRRLRERFAHAAAVQHETQMRGVRGAGAAYLELSTDRDWLLDVVRFAVARRRRR